LKSCTCKEKYAGDKCDKPICKTGCHTTNGDCTAPGECKCKEPTKYEGELCDKPICVGCHKTNGKCVSPGKCECKSGFDLKDGCTSPMDKDGGWSNWGKWGQCLPTCEDGIRYRYRTCTNPKPAHKGKKCATKSKPDFTETFDKESETCNNKGTKDEPHCPPAAVHGKWSIWSSWGTCSKKCGAGTQKRTRTCNNPEPKNGGDPCSGDETESKACNIKVCDTDGGWGKWQEWLDCKGKCGDNNGHRFRIRYCDNPHRSGTGKGCPADQNSDFGMCTKKTGCE